MTELQVDLKEVAFGAMLSSKFNGRAGHISIWITKDAMRQGCKEEMALTFPEIANEYHQSDENLKNISNTISAALLKAKIPHGEHKCFQEDDPNVGEHGTINIELTPETSEEHIHQIYKTLNIDNV